MDQQKKARALDGQNRGHAPGQKKQGEAKRGRKSESHTSPSKAMKPKADLYQFEDDMKFIEQQI